MGRRVADSKQHRVVSTTDIAGEAGWGRRELVSPGLRGDIPAFDLEEILGRVQDCAEHPKKTDRQLGFGQGVTPIRRVQDSVEHPKKTDRQMGFGQGVTPIRKMDCWVRDMVHGL
nr:hypothetical protein BaRGS_023729 [Batillaria attramentaria]